MRTSRLAKILAVLFAFTLIAAACGDDDGDTGEGTDTTQPPGPDPDGATGGTLVWVHEQEPPDMHLDDPSNNLSITSWILQSMVEGLYGVSSETTFIPELLAEEAEVVENEDGTVSVNYTLREGLSWSDGEPLTSADVEFWHNIIVEGCDLDDDGTINDDAEGCVFLIGSRAGYDQVTSFEVTSDTEFTVNFSSFFAGYPAMYNRVYAAHGFGEGATAEDVNEMLREFQDADGNPLPTSGPMAFESWNRGSSMNLVRNENYHGSVSPEVRNDGVAYVDGVEIQFVADTDTQVNALLAGEAHIIMTQPQTQFEQLAESDDFTVASSAGPVYEHWGFNMLNPHLSKPEVREAIAYALDKGEVIDGLYAPLFGDLLPREGLGNTYWMSNQPDYVDHQTEYDGAQIDQAAAKLEEAGYAENAAGIWEHPEDGPLSLRVGTTGGNALREDQIQIIQQQMADAGIEIIVDNVPGGAYFSERPFAPDAVAAAVSQGAEGDPTIWDITQFAWVGGPWPGSNTVAYRTGSENNPYGFSNPDFDAKASECETLIDDAERADCYNEADVYVTSLENGPNGLVVLPITQKPSFFGYLSSQLAAAGVAPDANDAGPIVYVMDFQFRD
ncbi:MAG: ABC transporter substrate-binding protein [Acidimicrobiales bacterium]